MKKEVKIPAMGESISEATIGSILKPAGSMVEADEEILELETEKVNQVLYAPVSGVFLPDVKEGDTVAVDQVVAHIDTEGKAETIPETKIEEPPKEETPEKERESAPASKTPEQKEKAAGTRSGARMTKEMFLSGIIDPETREEALKKEGEKSPPKFPEKWKEKMAETKGERRETRTKMSKIRKVIAARLVQSLQTSAMLTTFNEIDMSQIMGLRERYKEGFLKEHGVKLGFMSFFVKAVVSALHEFPGLNSYIENEDIVHRNYYDIGIAVGTDRGLIVPVVRDCDAKSFAEIEASILNYAVKAKDGTLNIQDLQGGGFTITNGGIYGSLLSTPILNPPQSGILGMHKIMKRPIAINDQVVIKPMMYAALSYDHRIVDGKEAVSFLVYLKNCLEDPGRMLLEI